MGQGMGRALQGMCENAMMDMVADRKSEEGWYD
jgi:hypothetical protein